MFARVKLKNISPKIKKGVDRWGETHEITKLIFSVLEYFELENFADPEKEVTSDIKELDVFAYDFVLENLKTVTSNNSNETLIIYYNTEESENEELFLKNYWREKDFKKRNQPSTITLNIDKGTDLTKLEIDNAVERMKRLEQESKSLVKPNLGKIVMEFWTNLKGEFIERLEQAKKIKRTNPVENEETLNKLLKEFQELFSQLTTSGVNYFDCENCQEEKEFATEGRCSDCSTLIPKYEWVMMVWEKLKERVESVKVHSDHKQKKISALSDIFRQKAIGRNPSNEYCRQKYFELRKAIGLYLDEEDNIHQ